MILKAILFLAGIVIGYFLGCFVTNIFYRDEEDERKKEQQDYIIHLLDTEQQKHERSLKFNGKEGKG